MSLCTNMIIGTTSLPYCIVRIGTLVFARNGISDKLPDLRWYLHRFSHFSFCFLLLLRLPPRREIKYFGTFSF
ncbi:hypothetical protein PIROE2DRAFT_9496 [Piromyces sp. E2]|nr:hypothetical protein PIROE2DRAFT_9496 [Piromyces sp. E2]|eukprot:OUM63891.1 hypothetical protein PIROE2DRAFT_9496 [Piromyces sp. E2]